MVEQWFMATSNDLKTFTASKESPQAICGCQEALAGIHGQTVARGC